MRSSRLTVGRAGVLALPAALCEAAGLQAGDILAVEHQGTYFVLEIYRELLDGAWEYMGTSALLGFVTRFLSHPLTAVERGGLVRIPAEAFPLPEGSAVTLYVNAHGCRHSLQGFVE